MNQNSKERFASNKTLYLSLCSICLGRFYDTGSYKIEQGNQQKTKDRYDFCNHRFGYDFIIYSKQKGKER